LSSGESYRGVVTEEASYWGKVDGANLVGVTGTSLQMNPGGFTLKDREVEIGYTVAGLFDSSER